MQPSKRKKIQLYTKILSFFPALLLLLLIFGFSSQTGEDSGSLSFQISLYLVRLFSPFLPAASTNEILMERADAIHFFVRKAAHMTEYFLLTLSLHLPMLVCFKNKLSLQKRLLIGFFAAVFFAAADEFHQSFVAGRSGNLMDVGIDSIGVLAATLLIYFISVIKKDRSHK